MTSLKRFQSIVFDAIVVLTVLSDNMNVITAKHVDFTEPFDGLIEGKDILSHFVIARNIKHGKLHGVHINDSHEVFFNCISSKNQDARGAKLVKAGICGEKIGLWGDRLWLF
jgi:hypothetical protein